MEIVIEITREEAELLLVWHRSRNCEQTYQEYELAKKLAIFTQKPSMDNTPKKCSRNLRKEIREGCREGYL